MGVPMNDLIERIEAASGPDRELDALIRCEVFAPSGAYVRQSAINGSWCIFHVGYDGKECLWEPRNITQEQRLGRFSASIDAALTLVPEDCKGDWSLIGGSSFQAEVGDDLANAATPALALCAAALKARAYLKETNNAD